MPQPRNAASRSGGGSSSDGRPHPQRNTTMKRSLIAGLLVAALATPALAAAQYYVAQNNSTHKCSIVSHKPDGTKLILLGSGGFKTKSQARDALKGMSECRA